MGVDSLEGTLIIFARTPSPYTCKRRLRKSIGQEFSYKFYQAFLKDLLQRLLALNDVHKIIAFTPQKEKSYFKSYESFFCLSEQTGLTLGDRMRTAFQTAFQNKFKKVIVIGSDAPDLPLEYIQKGFDALNKYDIVLGPASDGGYYLIGLSALHDVFGGIKWGENKVFDQTLKLIQKQNLKLYTLPMWHDIDDADALKGLENRLKKDSRTKLKWTSQVFFELNSRNIK